MGQYRWVMYSYILLHYHQYPEPQTFCLLDNMWILPLSDLVQLKYSSTISLYPLFFLKFGFSGMLSTLEVASLSLWNLTVWLLPKIKQGQQEGVWLYTHTPLAGHASDDWILSVPAEMQHHLSQENSSSLKAAQMENQGNATIQTS